MTAPRFKGLFFLFVAISLLFFSPSFCIAEQTLLVNGAETSDNSSLTMSDSDLIENELVFSIIEPDQEKEMAISIDGGEGWNDMTRDGKYLTYIYLPGVEETMHIMLKNVNADSDEDENSGVRDTGIMIKYQPQI